MKIFFVFVFKLCCNYNTKNNIKSDNIRIDVLNVEVSKYEKDNWLTILNITNQTQDTIYISKLEELHGTLGTEVDEFHNINLTFVNIDINKIRTTKYDIISSMPPDILYTDSSENLDKYYRNFLLTNYFIFSKHNGDKDYWVITPNSHITVKISIDFLLMDLAEIDLKKVKANNIAAAKLDIQIKYYINNFDTPINEIVTTSESFSLIEPFFKMNY